MNLEKFKTLLEQNKVLHQGVLDLNKTDTETYFIIENSKNKKLECWNVYKDEQQVEKAIKVAPKNLKVYISPISSHRTWFFSNFLDTLKTLVEKQNLEQIIQEPKQEPKFKHKI